MTQKKNYLPVLERSGYFHPSSFHYIKTNKIPSLITYLKIDVRRLFDHLVKEYSLAPEKIIRYDCYSNFLERSRLQSVWIELSDSITLSLINLRSEAEIYYDSSAPAHEIKKLESIIIQYVRKITEEKKVGLIVADSTGALDVREFTVVDMNENISALYNDDFLDFDSVLKEKLGNRNSRGLVLLHGIPGSGKSSYLRHVIGNVKKNFIYLPSNMADHIAQPNFINFLTRHPNSILIIEDAENVLMQRRAGSRSAVANLLNLSDGLLSDCLKIQVIATFNSDLEKIDEAFLRKGRILGRYCFEPLCVEKSNALLHELKAGYKTTTPMTLAEIFNHNEKDFGKMRYRNEVGFSMNGIENKN